MVLVVTAVLDRVGAALAVVGLAVLTVGAVVALADRSPDARPTALLVVAALAVAVTRGPGHRRRVRARRDPDGTGAPAGELCGEPEPEDRVTLARGVRWTCGRAVGHESDHAVVQGTRVARIWPRSAR